MITAANEHEFPAMRVSQLNEEDTDLLIYIVLGVGPATKCKELGGDTKRATRINGWKQHRARMQKNPARLDGINEDMDNVLPVAMRLGYREQWLSPGYKEIWHQMAAHWAQSASNTVSTCAPPQRQPALEGPRDLKMLRDGRQASDKGASDSVSTTDSEPRLGGHPSSPRCEPTGRDDRLDVGIGEESTLPPEAPIGMVGPCRAEAVVGSKRAPSSSPATVSWILPDLKIPRMDRTAFDPPTDKHKVPEQRHHIQTPAGAEAGESNAAGHIRVSGRRGTSPPAIVDVDRRARPDQQRDDCADDEHSQTPWDS